jgi:hypothetical protein
MADLDCATHNLLQAAEEVACALEMPGPDGAQLSSASFRKFVDELRHTEAALLAASNAKVSADKRAAAAHDALRDWLAKARLVVMLARGAKWSEHWVESGFCRPRTNIPQCVNARITLAQAVVYFFALHPELGVPFAGVTAAEGRKLYERAMQCREILRALASDCARSKAQWHTARRILQRKMRAVFAMFPQITSANSLGPPELRLRKKSEKHRAG